MLPDDFAPKSTGYHWFACWRDDGTRSSINHHLLMEARERCGREARAGAIDISPSRPPKAAGRGAMMLLSANVPREAAGFVPLPRRWVVERGFAWFGRN
tara:strand:- start:1086 stop:1382 length:297 start_codon:yes stop_codon:yes gene_type:complete